MSNIIYNFRAVENKWIDTFNNYYISNNAIVSNPSKKYYVLEMLPYPSGKLHMGHALDCTIQDTLIRYKRMCGFETLWVPGTDHAAISTEAKIVEQLKKEGLSKQSIGYDNFMKRALEWKETYGGCIVSQIKKMGASCDWSRERFTMDDICSRAVKRFFVSY